jgi:hypothetical protein
MYASRVLVAAFVAGGALNAHARDYGQYSDVPTHIRDWFKGLENPRTSVRCCDEADCARTEVHTRGGKWEARAPDGSWIAIPPESIVTNHRNPTGEPILCVYPGPTGNGWVVLCFVPGPDS